MAEDAPVRFETPVTLVGAGPIPEVRLGEALARAPALVAADGAGDALARRGRVPALVVGDMDSIADPAAWQGRAGTRLLRIEEQDTTDFEKCLYATEAPWYLAVGFTGGQIDHMLAVFHALLSRPEKRVVLLGEREIVTLVPPGKRLSLDLGAGARVSFYPLAETTGAVSEGLAWPIEGLTMAAGRQIGTSNRAVAERVAFGFDRPGALLMLDPGALDALLGALADAAPI